MLTRRQKWHAPWMRSHAEQRGVLWPGAHSSDGMCLAARQMPPSQNVWPACAGVSQKFPVRRPQSTQGRTRRASSPVANTSMRPCWHASDWSIGTVCSGHGLFGGSTQARAAQCRS